MNKECTNKKFKILQKNHYEKEIIKLDSLRTAIDKKGFSYSLTLKAAKIWQLIDSLCIFPGANVLDIGCRDGRLLNKLKTQFQTNNYGIDISLIQMQENVKTNPFNNNYFVADAEFLPFAENSFDFIFCFDVLEHTPDYQKCIEKITFLLNENGRALFYAISKKQKYTWGWLLRKITKGVLGKGMGKIHRQEYFLLPEEAAGWCRRCGLETEKLIYFHCFFVWAFDSFFLSVKDILSSSLDRRNIAKQKAVLTNDSKVTIYAVMIFIRIWSLFINSLLPILEFFDRLWQRKGYSSGFFLQVKKYRDFKYGRKEYEH